MQVQELQDELRLLREDMADYQQLLQRLEYAKVPIPLEVELQLFPCMPVLRMPGLSSPTCLACSFVSVTVRCLSDAAERGGRNAERSRGGGDTTRTLRIPTRKTSHASPRDAHQCMKTQQDERFAPVESFALALVA